MGCAVGAFIVLALILGFTGLVICSLLLFILLFLWTLLFQKSVFPDLGLLRILPIPAPPFILGLLAWGVSFALGAVFCFSTIVECWLAGAPFKRWSRLTFAGGMLYAAVGWTALWYFLVPALNDLSRQRTSAEGDWLSQVAIICLYTLHGLWFGVVTGAPFALSQWLALRRHSLHAGRFSLVVIGSNVVFSSGFLALISWAGR